MKKLMETRRGDLIYGFYIILVLHLTVYLFELRHREPTAKIAL